jgi:ubiquinol-cytochrome c reductase iron-sulfur subunit
MSDQHHHTPAAEVDLDDPAVSQFDLVREGARRDGVEIVHYAPRFTVPGTKEEKRVVRSIALCFAITGFMSLAFVVIYAAWHWEYHEGGTAYAAFTPLLGTTLGLALLALGAAIILWAKKLLPEEIAVQDRHDGGSDPVEARLTGATILNMVDETGIRRRPLLKAGLALGAAPLGLAAAAPLVGAMIRDPHPDSGSPL